jgi:hypothetical protein
MLLLLALLALLPAGVSGEAGGTGGGENQGIQVTMEVPFASESLAAVKTATPARKTRFIGNRAIPRKRIERVPASGPFVASAAFPLQPLPLSAPVVAPQAPVLDSSFAGLGNPPPGEDVIPPDTMGAAGPNHLVSLLNSEFGVFSKTGSKLENVSLRSFWASLGTDPGEPAHSPFDTKVLYDQYEGRFAAVTLGGTSAGSSWIMIAVSSSHDPTQTWSKWAIPSDQNNAVWADYPGFGLDAFNIYVTANMFNNNDVYQYSKIWVIPKGKLLSGSNPIAWTEFTTTSGSSLQPAHTFGTPPAEYFTYEQGSSRLGLARITNVASTPSWEILPSIPVTLPFISSVSLPGAPQLGSTNKIDTSDTRLLGAVYRAGSLWTVHHVQSPSVAKTEVAWYEIDPLTAIPTLKSSGRISDLARWYYYPSIGVNANGDVAIGMSGSSNTEYAGGFYAARRFADTPGVMQDVATLKAGERPYYKTLSGTENRWGDFSATVVDPDGNLRFWTLQEYAATPDNTWGTWWGSFALTPLSSPSAPTALTATPVSGSTIDLKWTDTSSNEERNIIERRTGSGAFSVIASPAVTDFSAYSDNTLSERTTYTYRIKAQNTLGDSSYSNESTTTTLLATPTGLNAVVASQNLVSISWNNNSTFLTGNIVERRTGTTGLFQTIANLLANTTSYSDNSVSAGNAYTYRVKAIDNVTPTQSAYSNEATVTVPGTITVSGGGGGGCLAMAPSSGAKTDVSSILSMAVLFLPAAVYGWRRRLRPGKR